MSKQDIEKRLGFAAQGVKAEMAIGSYKQGDRTVTVNGKKYEVLPYQMDFFIKELATLDTPEWRADVVKEYLRRGYIKTTAARTSAKAKFDREVGRKGNKSAMIAKNGPDADASWLAWVVQHHGEGQGESVLGTMRSYSTEARAKAAALRGLETSGLRGGFARPGAKAKMGRVIYTPQGSYRTELNKDTRVPIEGGKGYVMVDPAQYITPKRVRVQGTKGEIEVRAVLDGKEIVGVSAKLVSARPGVKAKMGRAEKVLSDGSVSLDFTEAKEWLSTVSDEALKYIISDSNAAAKAMGSGGKKFNYYTDLALTAAQMLRSTKRGGHRLNSSRPSAKAKMENSDGNYFSISGYVDNSILGNRTFDTQAEAEYYGKKMLESLKKDNSKAKDVNVQISKVIKYSPQMPFKTLSLRPGVKAKFAKPQFRTKKLHNGYIAVEVNQGNGWERYDTTHEESWNGIEEYERGYQKAYDQGLRYSGGAWRIPSTNASRPGAKAKFGRFSTEFGFLANQIKNQPDLAKKNIIVLAKKMGKEVDITRAEFEQLMQYAAKLGMETQVANAHDDVRPGFSRSSAKAKA